MSELIPPAGANDAEIEEFVASLRVDARARVRALIAAGAPEDEIAEYIATLDATPEDREAQQP